MREAVAGMGAQELQRFQFDALNQAMAMAEFDLDGVLHHAKPTTCS